MARNAPHLPRPRRGARRKRETAAALSSVAEGPVAAVVEPPPTPPPGDATVALDEFATVYSWLSRLATHPAETEQLLIEVLRRSRSAAPPFLRAASATTRLQFLTVQSVLQRRGVL